ncbi:MAG: hypothetical protein ACYCUD_03425 [Candidatus Dormibacteria bacterium]
MSTSCSMEVSGQPTVPLTSEVSTRVWYPGNVTNGWLRAMAREDGRMATVLG